MHDSFTPIGGIVPLVNMQLGELVFGGVGAGLYGMLMMVVLTVFIAGLMVGRTPEYLGKKVESREMRMVMLYVLVFPLVILVLTGVSVVLPPGLTGRNNAGPHGLTEILYAFTSTTANNGSAFAGLTGSTYYYNTLLGFATLFGRFAMHGADAGGRGVPGREADRARVRRHVPGHHAALRDAPHQRDPDRRRPDLLPCVVAGAGRGTPAHAGWEALLVWLPPSVRSSIR